MGVENSTQENALDNSLLEKYENLKLNLNDMTQKNVLLVKKLKESEKSKTRFYEVRVFLFFSFYDLINFQGF